MIVHVLERARESGADRTIVATDHEDVARRLEPPAARFVDRRRPSVRHRTAGGSGGSVRSAMTPLSPIFGAMSR
ncbi:hypothetical protein LNP74_25510 [Klebsiella pneumoniae subsp. pneumoniae]|nr:hypothetical protein [Klebsiella pneumoniae subsp. pneumoniae]